MKVSRFYNFKKRIVSTETIPGNTVSFTKLKFRQSSTKTIILRWWTGLILIGSKVMTQNANILPFFHFVKNLKCFLHFCTFLHLCHIFWKYQHHSEPQNDRLNFSFCGRYSCSWQKKWLEMSGNSFWP